MTAAPQPFALTLTRRAGYEFDVRFDGEVATPLLVDELPPLGAAAGPSPTRLLATAVAHCLCASFLFCVGKQRVEVRGLTARVEGTMGRNDKGRLRVERLVVRLEPDLAPADRPRIARCLEIFEEYCIVTQSVRHGVDVEVQVK